MWNKDVQDKQNFQEFAYTSLVLQIMINVPWKGVDQHYEKKYEGGKPRDKTTEEIQYNLWKYLY